MDTTHTRDLVTQFAGLAIDLASEADAAHLELDDARQRARSAERRADESEQGVQNLAEENSRLREAIGRSRTIIQALATVAGAGSSWDVENGGGRLCAVSPDGRFEVDVQDSDVVDMVEGVPTLSKSAREDGWRYPWEAFADDREPKRDPVDRMTDRGTIEALRTIAGVDFETGDPQTYRLHVVSPGGCRKSVLVSKSAQSDLVDLVGTVPTLKDKARADGWRYSWEVK